jgi:hypothetical protein
MEAESSGMSGFFFVSPREGAVEEDEEAGVACSLVAVARPLSVCETGGLAVVGVEGDDSIRVLVKDVIESEVEVGTVCGMELDHVLVGCCVDMSFYICLLQVKSKSSRCNF